MFYVLEAVNIAAVLLMLSMLVVVIRQQPSRAQMAFVLYDVFTVIFVIGVQLELMHADTVGEALSGLCVQYVGQAGFLMALLHLKETDIETLEVADPFVEGEVKEEKEGILDVKMVLNGGKKINIEMQNTYQDDWTERSLFYNCRMFTDGLKKGHPYGEIPPCIHVGILNFNQMISPNYYHKFSLMDEKTKEIYSRKFQFHMIELKKLKYVKEKQKKKPLYRWAKLIAAQTWEELEQESKGNKYMERALEEMIKISQDERERYLYLREEMAESDRASQIQSAQRIGRKEGEILKLISLVQKKILKNKTLPQIAEESEEDTIVIEPIYTLIKENPEAEKEEIYKMLNL